jgi:CelD/BcsL family acetyltransferase involved in cellulose biosynthesis
MVAAADSRSTKVEVVPAGSLTSEQLARWSQIQASDPALASPFFCPQFTSIVAVARDDVHVGVLEQDGRTVGFFPFHRGRSGAGRPVGWRISDYQGVIAERGAEWDAKELIRACGLKTWQFDHVIAARPEFEPFARIQTESPFMDLSRGFEAYLRERREAGVGEIGAAHRKMRKLAREHGELRFEPHSAEPEALATLLRWKQEQYLRTGVSDTLARDWIRRVLELVHVRQDESFAGLLSLLFAGERIVAAHLGLRSASVWHYWFPAYDPALARYSPGIALLLKMAEHAPSVALGTIDLGRGEERYKGSLKSGAVPLIEGRVELPSLAAAMGGLRRSARGLIRRTAVARPARRALRRVLGRA